MRGVVKRLGKKLGKEKWGNRIMEPEKNLRRGLTWGGGGGGPCGFWQKASKWYASPEPEK